MRLVRTMILLGAAGLFLPSPPEGGWGSGLEGDQPSAFEMLSSAGAAASDAASFCDREPAACGVAQSFMERLSAKALYSASLLFGWAGGSDGADGEPGSISVTVPNPDGETDPSTPAASEAEPQGLGRSTLRLDDLLPEWRGPDHASDKDG